MSSYLDAISAEFKRSPWNAFIVIVFTLARLIVGWDWFKAGWDKLTVEHWLSDGKFDSGGLLQGMVAAIQHSHGPDPLHLDNLLVWVTNHIFLNLGGFLDFLVILFEIVIGLFVFFGFGFIASMVAALFLNFLYATAGAANNFGYMVTDIVYLYLPTYGNLIGIDGYLRFRRGGNLLSVRGVSRKSKGNASDSNFKTPGGSGAPSKM